MISYKANLIYDDVEHRGFVVRIESARCVYNVAILANDIHIIGPGVDEVYEGIALPCKGLSPEAKAVYAVLLFEEGE